MNTNTRPSSPANLGAVLCGALLLAASCTPAGGPKAKPPGQPPAEAIAACQGKAAGDACSAEMPHGNTMEGSCQTPPDGEELACRPSGPPPGGPKPPPPGGPKPPPPGGPKPPPPPPTE